MQSCPLTDDRRVNVHKRCMEIQESQELQELRQNIVKYSHFLPPGFRFKVRVLIRFTCDSYVFAYVVHCILLYSDLIPVIPVFPYTLH